MGKRIDLNARHDNFNFASTNHQHPFYTSEDDIFDEELANDSDEITEEEQYSDYSEEVSEEYTNDIEQENLSNNYFNTVKEESKKTIIKIALKNPIVKKFLLIAIPIILIILLIIFIIAAISGENFGGDMAIGGYYAMRCPEVTVNFANKANDYEITRTATYPLEEYVAGVVAGEVGFLNNIEVDKEIALAARTYLLSHDDNCSIESSDRKQVFRELTNTQTDQLAKQAADETAGKVLLQNDSLYGVQYDAFCSIAVSDTEYTLKQKNQKIPRSWVDSQSGIAESWKQGTCAGNHGNGLSQWGSLYLATEKDMKYDEILKYYLGDEVVISSSGLMSIAGLEIKNTTDAKVLHEPLNTFLPNHGSSVEDLNNFIATSVNKNGNHTRAGVVTAAVSLVNYLYDGAKVRLPYYWGGQYQHIGVDPTFGGKASHAAISAHGNAYHYNGFDCSGFVSWAIKNGGFDIGRHTTAGFHRDYSGNSCNIGSASCKGQPGDLINSNGCHVQMIVSVDESSGLYYVAESTGSAGLIMRAWGMHESNCGGKETRILHMNSLYGD